MKIAPIAAAMLAALAAAGPSHAQTYPTKTIRMIVPIAPGGGTDTMARLISQRLAEQLGVTIIVDNRAGRALSSAPRWPPGRRPTATRS